MEGMDCSGIRDSLKKTANWDDECRALNRRFGNKPISKPITKPVTKPDPKLTSEALRKASEKMASLGV